MTNRDTAVVIVHSVLRELPTMITRLIIFNHRFEIHVISRHTSSASSTGTSAEREAQVLKSIDKARVRLELTCDARGPNLGSGGVEGEVNPGNTASAPRSLQY